MAKLTIKGKNFELDESPYKPQNLSNEEYIKSFNEIQEFINSPEYSGQSVEKIFDILISKEDIESQIDEIASGMSEPYFEELEGKYNKDLQDLRSELYRNYQDKYSKEFKTENKKIKDKWGKNVKELHDEIIGDFTAKHILDNFSEPTKNTSFDEVFKNVNNVLNHLKKEERDRDPDFYKMVNDWRNQANEVINYQKKFGSEKVTEAEYVITKLKTFKADYVNDPKYKAVEKELDNAKLKIFNERKEEIRKEYVSPLQNSKNLFLERKEQCINVLKAREDLAKDYYKTSLASRIARWVFPNSWSKAGKIQDELDKIDKAIKDAGYDKKDVENIKKEIKSEKSLAKNDNLENKVEVSSGINGPETTVDLQQGIKDRISQKEVIDKSNVIKQDNPEKVKVGEKNNLQNEVPAKK